MYIARGNKPLQNSCHQRPVEEIPSSVKTVSVLLNCPWVRVHQAGQPVVLRCSIDNPLSCDETNFSNRWTSKTVQYYEKLSMIATNCGDPKTMKQLAVVEKSSMIATICGEHRTMKQLVVVEELSMIVMICGDHRTMKQLAVVE